MIKIIFIIFFFFFLDTSMTSLLNEKVKRKLVDQIEYPARFGKPDGEFNKLAIHLIENTFMNGEIIRIDGGTKLGKL